MSRPGRCEFYDRRVGELIAWLHSEAPTVERVEDVGVNHLRAFRAFMTERRRPDGQPLQAATLHASHRAIHTFLAWAELDGYGVDGRMLRLPPPRRPHKEATVFHVTQLRAILTACKRPEETLAVRVLVGSGLRISELSGLAVRGPDGLSDVMLELAGTRTCRAARALGCRRQGSQGPARADHAATRARHQALRRSRSDEERPGRIARQPARAGRMASGGSTR